MNNFDRQIKEIEEYLSSDNARKSNELLTNLGAKIGTGPKAINKLKDMYTNFGSVDYFLKVFRSYINQLKSSSESYWTLFARDTGISSGPLHFKEEYKLKGYSGSLRPSRRRLNKGYQDSDIWSVPLEDYLNHINFKKYLGIDKSQLDYEILGGMFTDSIGNLVTLGVEDILQQLALRIKNEDKVVSSGFVGLRTTEYGGDMLYKLAYTEDGVIFSDGNLVKDCFKRYQFDISCLVSSVTISSKFNIRDFSAFDLGLDESKDYYLGTFICISTRHFNHFSDSVPSPFVYLKPMVVLFEEEGWVHYHQTKWMEMPSTLLNSCYDLLVERLNLEYT